MRFLHWLRPFAARLNPVRKQRVRPRPTFRPRLEELEDRITPSTVQLIDPPINFVGGPTNLTTVNSTLYFVADDGTHSTELWRTDGQPGDVARVQGGQLNFDQVSAAGGREQVPEEAQVGRWLYYFTDNGDSTYTLWRNDSTASPTDGISSSEAILTIPDPISNDDGPYQLKAVGSDLYFGTWSVADSAWELWKVTGADSPSGANLTAAKVQASDPSHPIDSNGPTNIWAAGSNLYFTADSPDGNGGVLWGIDSTTGEIAPVQDAGGDYVSPLFYGTAAVGTDLYTIDTNHTLYRVSGQEATPVELRDLTGTQIASVGDPFSQIDFQKNFNEPTYFMTVAGDSVYFLANDHDPSRSQFQYDLWKINGSTASEVWQSPADVPGTPFRALLSPLEMAAVGSDVYFSDQALGVGSDLWKSDGTPDGTELMKSFQAGVDQVNIQGFPIGLTPVGSTLYFEGPDARLWQSGGTPETTYTTGDFLPALGDIAAAGDVFLQDNHSPNYPGAFSPFAAVGSTLYISPEAFDGGVGQLWRLNNPPVLNSAVSSATDTSISGNFSESADANTTITLNFYGNTVADPSGVGPGQTFLGSTTVTTDANGNAAFTADLAVGNLAGQWITATATDPDGNTSNFAFDVQATAASSQTLQSALPQSSTTANSMTIQASASNTPATVIAAVNGLTNVTQPVTIILDLGGGNYSIGNLVYNPADSSNAQNVTFIIQNGTLAGSLTIDGGNVQLVNVTMDPDEPALTVAGGQVSVVNCTLTTSGNAPTLLVTGGNVTLTDDEINQTSTISTQPAIAVTGGIVNLGTATTPGNNTLSVNNSGNLVSNTSGNPISDVGNSFVIGGTVESAPSLGFTSLTSSSASSVSGQSVTFTATVASGMPGSATPTGSVDFFDTTTGTYLGSRTLSDGVATFNISSLAVGSHTITATYSGDGTFLGSNSTLSQVVNKATPYFSLGAPPTVISGTSMTQITGAIAEAITDGSLIPTGNVTVTVNGISQSAAINSDGTFAVTVPTASLGTGSYTIYYAYAGDNNFTSANATANMSVANGILALFNQSQAKHAGSTIPIQIELVSTSGQDLSSAGTTVTALGMAATTDTTHTVGSIDPSLVGALQPVQAAGNSNPNNLFREQGGSQPFYMYNLQTPTGLTAGTYRLYFQAQGDPLWHWVTFSVS